MVLTFPFSVLWLKGGWGSALASRLSCCTWGLSFICLVPGLGREVLPPFVRVLLFQWLQSVVLVPKCEMDKPVPRGTNSGGLWAASLVSAQSCCRQAVSRVSAMCAKPGLLQQSHAEEDCVRISEENVGWAVTTPPVSFRRWLGSPDSLFSVTLQMLREARTSSVWAVWYSSYHPAFPQVTQPSLPLCQVNAQRYLSYCMDGCNFSFLLFSKYLGQHTERNFCPSSAFP